MVTTNVFSRLGILQNAPPGPGSEQQQQQQQQQQHHHHQQQQHQQQLECESQLAAYTKQIGCSWQEPQYESSSTSDSSNSKQSTNLHENGSGNENENKNSMVNQRQQWKLETGFSLFLASLEPVVAALEDPDHQAQGHNKSNPALSSVEQDSHGSSSDLNIDDDGSEGNATQEATEGVDGEVTHFDHFGFHSS